MAGGWECAIASLFAEVMIDRVTGQPYCSAAMTKRLEQAFSEAAKLPPEEQEAFAAILLEELASERRWADAFAKSPQTLSRLAAEALDEHRAGRTRPFENNDDLDHP